MSRMQDLIDRNTTKAPPMGVITARLPAAIKDRFVAACKALGVDRSEAVATALAEQLERLEEAVATLPTPVANGKGETDGTD